MQSWHELYETNGRAGEISVSYKYYWSEGIRKSRRFTADIYFRAKKKREKLKKIRN